jgi:hypothetical protein
LRIRFQKISNRLGLVSREIVEDDVDLLIPSTLRRDLVQELDKV